MSLEDRIKALEQRPPPKHGEHGQHGRQGDRGERGLQGDPGLPGQRGKQGPQGEQGERGEPGADGKSISVDDVVPIIADGIKAAVDLIPRPKDGERGRTGIPGANGKDGAQGPRGEPGRKGDKGEIGPMPAHRWDGTRLQFEQAPDGHWGKLVDLQGPPGKTGKQVFVGGGGGSSTGPVVAAAVFSYFPSGWT